MRVRVKPAAVGRSGEATSAEREPTNSGRQDLLEQVLARENLQRALQRVKRNAGSAGVDGMTVAQLPAFLRTAWPRLRGELLDGTYRPQPVRRHAIPKPGGGERELGIPTVLDRFIQQALLQVLQPVLDPGFSDASYGFRPGRRARDAIRRAQGYVQAGHRVVVDVDLEKFFDRVNHDILMARVARRIGDRRVLGLIRRYLDAGIMVNGVKCDRHRGTPQGGPLSPLLANVLLDDVDRMLERGGHRFVRYADDCNVYVRSRRAGERVLARLRRCYARLKLTVNETKSAVAPVRGRAFLGYTFWFAARGTQVRRAVATKAMQRFKDRIRTLTRRTGGRSIEQVVDGLRAYLPGWKAYFQLAQTPGVFRELDQWLRHRLRALHLKQWKRGSRMYTALVGLGASPSDARVVANNSCCWWANSRYRLNRALPISYFDRLGVPKLS
ncbi:MAG: group II intron reverse transcriptase/maturase [Nitrococcus sp.]|nr:group II intron reverse transcriptase/maturase [Nitrococcus sp.]